MSALLTLRDGSLVEDPRLDRLELFDPESRNYQIRELLDKPLQTSRSLAAKYHLPGPTLDQDQEGQCVAECCVDRRNGSPLKNRPLITVFEDRRTFYHECQHADPWAGCYLGMRCPIQPSRESYGGTAVLTGMKLGRDRGWWDSFRWIGAGSGLLEDDVIQTLRTVGGICFGIPWHEGMYETKPDGLVEVTGKVVGGHAIHGFEWIPRLRLPRSFQGTKPAVAWHNSWGDAYGITRRRRTGVGFILLDDLLALLERGGEGAVPLKTAA